MTVCFISQLYSIHTAHGKQIPSVMTVTITPNISHPICCKRPPSKYEYGIETGVVLLYIHYPHFKL